MFTTGKRKARAEEKPPPFPSQLQQVSGGPSTPQGGRDKNAVVGFPVDKAGALDTHVGGKRHQRGVPDKHD